MKDLRRILSGTALETTNFAGVYTHRNTVLIILQPKEEIREETHTLDQFMRVDAGDGVAILEGVKHRMFDRPLSLSPRERQRA
jgi:hypothetical protein